MSPNFLNGIKINPQTGDPASPTNGDVWYNSTTGKYRARQNGITVDLVTAATSASMSEIEIDFGATPVKSKKFAIVDAGVVATSKVFPQISGKAATGRAADENEMDAILVSAQPTAGGFYLFANCITGRVSGKFKLNYLIG